MSLKDDFQSILPEIEQSLTMENGDWTIKGFIDTNKNIYTISIDTKVVSKIAELMIFPIIIKFATENNYKLELANHQNHYPDITLIDRKTNKKYAIDIKSTYRKSDTRINGMTLGTFTGYFRNRDSNGNITYPYNEYEAHYVLGMIYSRADINNVAEYFKNKGIALTVKAIDSLSKYLTDSTDDAWELVKKSSPNINDSDKGSIDDCIIDERNIFNLDNFHTIKSVVKDFKIFFVEKWKIAHYSAGSGNTKNIGSVKLLDDLINEKGSFSALLNGKQIFDDYWKHFENGDMARNAGRETPLYNNIESYNEWKNR